MAYQRNRATGSCPRAREIADRDSLVRANLCAATAMWGRLENPHENDSRYCPERTC